MKSKLAFQWILTTAAAIALALFVAGCAPAGEESDDSEASSSAGSDAEVIAYTMDTCIVSGEELGSMGDPIVKVYNGKEVKFCCEDCVGEFEAEKDKFLAKLTEMKGEMEEAAESATNEAKEALNKVLPGSE